MLGNIFFSFTYIDETSQTFQDWISMVGGLFENMGIEKTDLNTHKTVLAFLTGGLLPIISLTFAHMLVKFTEKNKEVIEDVKTELTEEDVQKIFEEQIKEKEKEKWTPSNEDLEKLEEILRNNYPLESEIKTEPYKPSEDDLQKLETILEKFNEKPTEEIIQEKEPEIVENIEVQNVTTQEVEKKNNELSEQGEVYKVLNYIKRDA
jgi:hypothetical protein